MGARLVRSRLPSPPLPLVDLMSTLDSRPRLVAWDSSTYLCDVPRLARPTSNMTLSCSLLGFPAGGVHSRACFYVVFCVAGMGGTVEPREID